MKVSQQRLYELREMMYDVKTKVWEGRETRRHGIVVER